MLKSIIEICVAGVMDQQVEYMAWVYDSMFYKAFGLDKLALRYSKGGAA